jgi:hypothetical protein
MRKLGMALAIATILACQSGKKAEQTIDSAASKLPQTPDSISYKYDSVKVYSKNPVSADARVTDTAKAVISYPVFTDNKLNDFVLKNILGSVDGEKTYNSYEEYTKGFIKDFDDFQKGSKDQIQTWFLSIQTKVIKQKPQYIGFFTIYSNYSGGAHANSSFNYRNYNPVTHQEITLDSLLIPGSSGKLQAIAERLFRKNEKLTPDQSLKNNYFFENDTFKLNNNFTITDEGLLFLYNPYEIKAFAFGITKLLIPYSELKDITKPNSLISVNK